MAIAKEVNLKSHYIVLSFSKSLGNRKEKPLKRDFRCNGRATKAACVVHRPLVVAVREAAHILVALGKEIN